MPFIWYGQCSNIIHTGCCGYYNADKHPTFKPISHFAIYTYVVVFIFSTFLFHSGKKFFSTKTIRIKYYRVIEWWCRENEQFNWLLQLFCTDRQFFSIFKGVFYSIGFCCELAWHGCKLFGSNFSDKSPFHEINTYTDTLTHKHRCSRSYLWGICLAISVEIFELIYPRSKLQCGNQGAIYRL